MSFFKSVGKLLTSAAKVVIEKNEEMHKNYNQNRKKLARYSNEALIRAAKTGSTNSERMTARQLLKERLGEKQATQVKQARETNKRNKFQVNLPENTTAFRKGDSTKVKTTIILSAPGQEEEKAGRPAAGQTGKNLQSVIETMHAKDPIAFPSPNLDDYPITNAVETVRYMSKTGDTEGTDEEVCDTNNINRIKKELGDSQNILALGEKAQLAASQSGFDGKVLKANHPSMVALNRKYKSDKATPSERSKDRIKQWSETITD